MLITISRRYHFEAAHYLPKVAAEHKCRRLHGHNYVLDVTVASPVQEDGFVLDFWELDRIVQPLIDRVDHRLLNDIHGLENPTAELIGKWFLLEFTDERISGVRVYETPECWADVSF